VGPMVCLDGCGKSRPLRDSNPGLSFYCRFPPAAILFLLYLLSASFFMCICIFVSFVCVLVLAPPVTLVLLNLHVGKYPKDLIQVVRNVRDAISYYDFSLVIRYLCIFLMFPCCHCY